MTRVKISNVLGTCLYVLLFSHQTTVVVGAPPVSSEMKTSNGGGTSTPLTRRTITQGGDQKTASSHDRELGMAGHIASIFDAMEQMGAGSGSPNHPGGNTGADALLNRAGGVGGTVRGNTGVDDLLNRAGGAGGTSRSGKGKGKGSKAPKGTKAPRGEFICHVNY